MSRAAPILLLLASCAAPMAHAPTTQTSAAAPAAPANDTVTTSAEPVAEAPVEEPPLPSEPIEARCNVTRDVDAFSRPSLRRMRGRVSYYADSLHGRRTASGDRYDRGALTAASRELPFGTVVRIRRVDRPSEGVVVIINDRGPFGRNQRILDLSRRAAECIDMIRAGVVLVEAEVLELGPGRAHR